MSNNTLVEGLDYTEWLCLVWKRYNSSGIMYLYIRLLDRPDRYYNVN